MAEFSEYVLEMTLEDDYNSTPLTTQFSVGCCVFQCGHYILSIIMCREFQVLQLIPTLRPASHIMWGITGSGTYTHVRLIQLSAQVIFNFLNTDDNSRVCLRAIPGVIGSDYINASFISVRICWLQILFLMIFKFC